MNWTCCRSAPRVAIVAALLAIGTLPAGAQVTPAARPAQASIPDTATAAALSAAFRAASERALPAVVYIASEQQAQVVARPDLLERLPVPFRDMLPVPDGPTRPRTGSGSGVIIDAAGHILTNNHVVAEATRLTVRMVDGREYSARLVGGDVASDVAVIRIEPRDGERLPVAQLADADNVRVGDWVLALGSPLGLDFTVTAGIVSAKGRRMPGGAGIEAFIQTDAVINPGNSGGPLIDLYGRVVGINSAIFGSDRFVGYGFAVPITIARRVAQDLLEYGYLRRPRIGLAVRAVDAVDAELYGLREIRGAFVVGVEHDGVARTAGIRAGDIVSALNGTPIRDDGDFIARLAELRPQQEATISLLRDGRPLTLRVRLGEWERPEPQRAAAAEQPAGQGDVLGFTVRDLTPADAQRVQYSGEGGVVVDTVSRFGAAVGFVGPGQIVLAVNGQRVSAAAQVREIASRMRPGDPVSITVYDPRYGETVRNYRTR
jgi:serine protease Do